VNVVVIDVAVVVDVVLGDVVVFVEKSICVNGPLVII
jgi:hypothetical protein